MLPTDLFRKLKLLVELTFCWQFLLNSIALHHLSLGSSVTYTLQQRCAGLRMKYDYYAHTSEMMGSLKALLRLLDIVQMFCMLEFSIPSVFRYFEGPHKAVEILRRKYPGWFPPGKTYEVGMGCDREGNVRNWTWSSRWVAAAQCASASTGFWAGKKGNRLKNHMQGASMCSCSFLPFWLLVDQSRKQLFQKSTYKTTAS